MTAIAPNVDDTGATKHGEVLGDRAERHVRHRVGDHAGRELVIPHELQNVLPAWLRDDSQQITHSNILVVTEMIHKRVLALGGAVWVVTVRWQAMACRTALSAAWNLGNTNVP
jgi:hypothetical protein